MINKITRLEFKAILGENDINTLILSDNFNHILMIWHLKNLQSRAETDKINEEDETQTLTYNKETSEKVLQILQNKDLSHLFYEEQELKNKEILREFLEENLTRENFKELQLIFTLEEDEPVRVEEVVPPAMIDDDGYLVIDNTFQAYHILSSLKQNVKMRSDKPDVQNRIDAYNRSGNLILFATPTRREFEEQMKNVKKEMKKVKKE